MLKGWVDRVLQTGFAQGEFDESTGLPRRYGDGRLIGRKALIVVTAGDDQRTLGPGGISGDIDTLLFPLTHGALWYVGIEALTQAAPTWLSITEGELQELPPSCTPH